MLRGLAAAAVVFAAVAPDKVGEGILAALVDAGYVGAARRVSSADSYIPLGNAAKQLLVSEEMIEQGVRSLLGA